MLPVEKEMGPQGGRPQTAHRTVLKVIWFVLVTGCRWKDVPQEMGCCGETVRTRLQACGARGHLGRVASCTPFLTMLHQQQQLHLETAIIDSTQVRAFGGGDATGLSPVDRRKKGTKFTLLVDRDGVPLVIHTSPANSVTIAKSCRPSWNCPWWAASQDGRENFPRTCMPTRVTTVKPREACFVGWAFSRTFAAPRRNMVATWDASAGWWSAPSVGSKGSAAREFAMIGLKRLSTLGRASPLPLSVYTFSGKPHRRRSFLFSQVFGSLLA